MAPDPAEPTIVRHFGSRVGVAGGGGIASVIATHGELPYRTVRPKFVATSRLGARFWSAQYLPGAVVELLRARTARQPSIVHVHLAGGGSVVREGGLVRLARRLGLATVVTVHASDLADVARGHPRRLVRILRAAHVVHALGHASTDILRTVGGSDLDVAIVPNPVSIPANVTDAGANDPVALFAGEQSLRKGLDVLMQAWPLVRVQVPDATLIVAGNERDFDVPPLDGVRVLGAVPRERVAHELRSARVAVLPSRMETQPMFILEAMAAARPIVATRIAEIPRTVVDQSGVVEPEDVEGLARALTVFLSDPARATTSGTAERAQVVQTHSPLAACRSYEAIYALALERAARCGRGGPGASVTRGGHDDPGAERRQTS